MKQKKIRDNLLDIIRWFLTEFQKDEGKKRRRSKDNAIQADYLMQAYTRAHTLIHSLNADWQI